MLVYTYYDCERQFLELERSGSVGVCTTVHIYESAARNSEFVLIS